MEQMIHSIIQLFHTKKEVCYELKEIRLEDQDQRWVLFVNFPNETYVIKIAANNFTTQERIHGWIKIIEAYRDLGYYSPSIRKSVHNHYTETVRFHSKQCVVWEEEYANYHLYSTLDKSVYRGKDGKFVYHNEILAFLGTIAQQHYDFFPYPSGWVRLEPFGIGETTDEITECVKTFDRLVREKAPNHIPRWEQIYALFEENKKQLAEIYPSLPTSVFQSDHFESNLLFDRNGHFKGVIDYNLAGRDVVINVFLYTMLYYYYNPPKVHRPDMLSEYNPIKQDFIIQNILDAFQYLRKFYTFNKDEAQAILPLYKYCSCIEYTQIELFKKYQEDGKKLDLLFHAMEHELRRQENRFYEVMLE